MASLSFSHTERLFFSAAVNDERGVVCVSEKFKKFSKEELLRRWCLGHTREGGMGVCFFYPLHIYCAHSDVQASTIHTVPEVVGHTRFRVTVASLPTCIKESGAAVQLGLQYQRSQRVFLRITFDAEAQQSHPLALDCGQDAPALAATANVSTASVRIERSNAGADGDESPCPPPKLALRLMAAEFPAWPHIGRCFTVGGAHYEAYGAPIRPFHVMRSHLAFFRAAASPATGTGIGAVATAAAGVVAREIARDPLFFDARSYRAARETLWFMPSTGANKVVFAVRVRRVASCTKPAAPAGTHEDDAPAAGDTCLLFMPACDRWDRSVKFVVPAAPRAAAASGSAAASTASGVAAGSSRVPLEAHFVPAADKADLPFAALWRAESVRFVTSGGAPGTAYIFRSKESETAPFEYVFDGSAVTRCGHPVPACPPSTPPPPMYDPATLRLREDWAPEVFGHAYAEQDREKLLRYYESFSGDVPDGEEGRRITRCQERRAAIDAAAAKYYSCEPHELFALGANAHGRPDCPFRALKLRYQPIIFIAMRAAPAPADAEAGPSGARAAPASAPAGAGATLTAASSAAAALGAAAATPAGGSGSAAAVGGAGAASGAASSIPTPALPPAPPPALPSPAFVTPCVLPATPLRPPIAKYSAKDAADFACALMRPLMHVSGGVGCTLMLQTDESEGAAPLGFCYRSRRWGEPAETAGRALVRTSTTPALLPAPHELPPEFSCVVGAIFLPPLLAMLCVPPDERRKWLRETAALTGKLSVGWFARPYMPSTKAEPPSVLKR